MEKCGTGLITQAWIILGSKVLMALNRRERPHKNALTSSLSQQRHVGHLCLLWKFCTADRQHQALHTENTFGRWCNNNLCSFILHIITNLEVELWENKHYCFIAMS